MPLDVLQTQDTSADKASQPSWERDRALTCVDTRITIRQAPWT
jgi:hypothetical protein